jgi:large subunit ribosomal protein L33
MLISGCGHLHRGIALLESVGRFTGYSAAKNKLTLSDACVMLSWRQRRRSFFFALKKEPSDKSCAGFPAYGFSKTEVDIMRTKITLACTECKQRNYNTTKEKKNHPERMEIKKYCRFCRKHTLHRETK